MNAIIIIITTTKYRLIKNKIKKKQVAKGIFLEVLDLRPSLK